MAHGTHGHDNALPQQQAAEAVLARWLHDGAVQRLDLPEITRDTPLALGPDRLQDPEALAQWLGERQPEVAQLLLTHGALFFRGFGVNTGPRVEVLAHALAAADGLPLQNFYMGTSPRENVTDYVFSASELPEFYPIPQHCEMSFVAQPPQRLFFAALVAPGEEGGETPLCDMAAVWNDLPANVRDDFANKGLQILRWYAAPGQKLDPWQLKPWPDMFKTTDRQVVEAISAKEGFVCTWLGDGALSLVSTQPAMQLHPVSNVPVWFNHSQVFHLQAAPIELRQILKRRPDFRALGSWLYAEWMVQRKKSQPDDRQPMQCRFADGTPIPRSHMQAVSDAIWRQQVAIPWQTGDFVAIDNRRMSHGRLPYRGPRTIVVAWA